MASFIVQPHVAEFVDVVMHERSLEFRMQEIAIAAGSPLVRAVAALAPSCASGPTCWCSRCAWRTARSSTTPTPTSSLEPGQVLIAVGEGSDLRRLDEDRH